MKDLEDIIDKICTMWMRVWLDMILIKYARLLLLDDYLALPSHYHASS